MVTIKIGTAVIDPLPEKIQVTRKGGGKVYTLADGTEIVRPGKAGLAEIEFTAFTSDKSQLDYLKTAFRSGTPLWMSVTGLVSPILLHAVVVTLETWEQGGCIEVIHYRIVLREYQSKSLKFLYDASALTSAAQSSAAGGGTTNTYTVQKGDTLWKIAKKYLGDGSKYTALVQLNGLKNANLIHPGQVIRLR